MKEQHRIFNIFSIFNGHFKYNNRCPIHFTISNRKNKKITLHNTDSLNQLEVDVNIKLVLGHRVHKSACSCT